MFLDMTPSPTRAGAGETPTRSKTGRVRLTQQERSEATQRALLDATIASLVEDGYARTTTARVSERAGLSRGAHLHHFHTRSGLITAALERFSERLIERVERQMEPLHDSPDRTAASLDLLWDTFTDGLFMAAIDLWTVARTDPDLREALLPAEHALNRQTMRLCRLLFSEHADRPDFDRLVDFALSTVRGLAILQVVQPSLGKPEKRWLYARDQVLEAFKRPPPPGARS
jgi:AcrR family transcriptional regulator